MFSYEILTPAALSFFVNYADGAVESLWSIDQYFEFVLVLMLSTGLSFQVGRAAGRGLGHGWTRRRLCAPAACQHCSSSQSPLKPPASAPRPGPTQVPVIQVMLGKLGLVTSEMMFSQWRYVVVGATVAAAVLTPSTDPFTQTLLALPLIGLYMGGATAVRALEARDKLLQ